MTVAGRKGSFLNPVSNAREVFSIVRQMSFDEVRDSALRVPRIVVIGPTVEAARQSALEIFGEEWRDYVMPLLENQPLPNYLDIVLVDRRSRVDRSRIGADIVEFSHDDPIDRTRQAVVRSGFDFEMALGRTFPALRQCAAKQIVTSTSRVNAQFAMASNIPALVPVVGGVLAAGADMIVLTKNQLMMLFKMAAVHDQDIDNRMRIYREMVPVVGAGLFWRSVARSLAAMMPFAAGAVPKVTIAFAGTYAVGMAAHVYYHEGTRANAERMREFYRQAIHELRNNPTLAKAVPARFRSEKHPPIEATYRVE
jgi:uncharacterized protein (DUF697 family)